MAESVRPQFKAAASVHRHRGLIQIRGAETMLDMVDPTGDVERLLLLLDGSRGLDEIETAFGQAPARRPLDVRHTIAQLDLAGVLVDSAATTTMDGYCLERCSRNLAFFESYSSVQCSKYQLQERLRDCRVTVLGLGGTGSHLVLDLLGAGVEDITILDSETLELADFNCQVLYDEMDVGSRRVRLAAERLRAHSHRARVSAVEQRVESTSDLFGAVRGRDVVLGTFDRTEPALLNRLNAACVAAGTPFLCGGFEPRRLLVCTVVPGLTGCVECWRRAADDDTATAVLEGGTGSATFGPLVAVQSGLMLADLVRLVTGISPPLSLGRLIGVSFDDLVPREVWRWSRLPACPVCRDVDVDERLRNVGTNRP